MSNLRCESHVAQQIRRDKLRIQNVSQNLQEVPNNLEQLSSQQGFSMDLLQVRNVRNANMLDEPPVYASEMPNFLSPLSASRNALEYQELSAAEPNRLMMHQYGSFPQKEQSELRNLENWRNGNPHQGCDWVVNYANSSLANIDNTNSFLAIDAYQHYGNASGEIAGREFQKHLGVMHPPPPSSPYHNGLQDIVKSASISAHKPDMASLMQQTGQGIWVGDTSELELQPCYANQQNHLRFGWTNRPLDNTFPWSSTLGFTDKKVDEHPGPVPHDSNPQSLSLSLSSNAQSKACVSQFEEGSASDDARGISKDPHCLNYMKTFMKPSIDCGKSLQDTMGIPSKIGFRNVGPLGPFTGYATILKSSRFLKTAQQLLDEFCCISGPKCAKTCNVSERVSREVSASTSADTVTVNESVVASKGNINSGSSSSLFYISNENSADWEARSSCGLSLRPDYQQKRAKLLYMQEEVTRRYKQYHQQMQMVVSSFESVAGLSSATPYISLALKSVSKYFRCLNISISDQLKVISEVLGEELTMPTTSTSSKGEINMARLRCMDESFQKNKTGRGLELQQQHVWRPQRGLPERSVAILRAWLFEHFLHPYPTDTDKHMLATQTGLSRNQVSNWFINARVRVWKPMVEEIHMLEIKTTGPNENKNEGTSGTEGGTCQPRVEKPLNKFGMHEIHENQFQGMEMGSSNVEEQWSQEKRSKLEGQMTTSSMDGTLTSFLPCRHGGLDVGGLGSVSLTLGLRHGVEGVQHHHHHHQLQEEQLRHHLGGQMIHDFVG